uniref:S-layer homology domain-containing protein n=1 Tax=Paenibacillus sp. YIM B09110 TaxID=3126102 RepID=UPI00301C19BF
TATATSNVVLVTVNAIVNAATPTIGTQPTAKTVDVGGTATLSVVASVSDGGTLSYQWYSNTSNSTSGGTLLSGAMSASYNAPTTAAGTKYYYVVLTNTNASVNGTKTATATSNVVLVTVNAIVNAATPSIGTQPTAKTVNVGETATLSVVASVSDGGTLSYQWYSNTTNSTSGGTLLSGATSASYNAPTTAAGTKYYYVVVTNTNDSVNGTNTASATSSVVSVTVNTSIENAATPSIETEPTSMTVNVDGAATLSVTASVSDGGTLSYQWYSNTTNSTSGGTLVDEAIFADYNPPTATEGTTYYYVVITNTNASVNGTKTASATSSIVAVTVSEEITYKIEAIDNQTGDTLTQGYEPDTQQTITIHINNIGTGDLTDIAVSTSGADANSFEITQPASTLNSGSPSTSFTVKAMNGLAAGTYTMTVIVSAAQMDAMTFTVTQVVNLPGVLASPNHLQAAAGNESVGLRWDAVEEADEYEIYVATASGHYDDSSVATVRGTSYSVTGLTNGITYYFAVKAGNSGVWSSFSGEVSATPATVPSAPTNVQARAGDKKATVSFEAPEDNGGSAIIRYEVTAYPGGITATGTTTRIVVSGLSNGKAYTFTVRAINGVGPGEVSAVSNSVKPSKSTTTPQPPTPPVDGVRCLVNGQLADILGKVLSTTTNDRMVLTLELDSEKLTDWLKKEKQGAVITLDAGKGFNAVIVKLNGEMIRNLQLKEATLVVRTEKAVNTIAAKQINIDAIAERFGNKAQLQDIIVQISVADSSDDMVKKLQDAADRMHLVIVSPAITFTIQAEYDNKTYEQARYKAYSERLIAIAPGVNPSKVSTAVAIEPNGEFRHVPSKIILIDGKYYVQLSDLSNGTFAIVYHSANFFDVEGHWAKAAINDLGARLVLRVPASGLFQPNRDITRAEFADMIVRGLGLSVEQGTTSFVDVKEGDWYSGAVQTAYSYGLIEGFPGDKFRPNDRITREQAFVIMAKAMKLINPDKNLQAIDVAAQLHRYSDADSVSEWAKNGLANCLEAGIVSGRAGNRLSPKAYITRAEVATMVLRFLQQSKLI